MRTLVMDLEKMTVLAKTGSNRTDRPTAIVNDRAFLSFEMAPHINKPSTV
jgi:hypothetical protein